MKVKTLRDWLKDKPDEANVRVMVETDTCQFDFPANDFALSVKTDGTPSVIIMHENIDFGKR